MSAEIRQDVTGRQILRVICNGYYGAYNVSLTSSSVSSSVIGEQIYPMSSGLWFESGIVGFRSADSAGYSPYIRILSAIDVVLMFYHETRTSKLDIVLPAYRIPSQPYVGLRPVLNLVPTHSEPRLLQNRIGLHAVHDPDAHREEPYCAHRGHSRPNGISEQHLVVCV